MSKVLLRHKKTGHVWECAEEAADGWKELGWEKAPKDAKPTVESPAIAAATTTEEGNR